MATYTWKPEYSVKVDDMDAQHKQLFHLIGSLHDAMLQGKGKAALGGILGDLLGYTERHFAAEERLLQRVNYPKLAEQKTSHRSYEEAIKKLKQEHEAGNAATTIKTLDFLNKWLKDHICGMDRQYADYVKKAA